MCLSADSLFSLVCPSRRTHETTMLLLCFHIFHFLCTSFSLTDLFIKVTFCQPVQFASSLHYELYMMLFRVQKTNVATRLEIFSGLSEAWFTLKIYGRLSRKRERETIRRGYRNICSPIRASEGVFWVSHASLSHISSAELSLLQAACVKCICIACKIRSPLSALLPLPCWMFRCQPRVQPAFYPLLESSHLSIT